jgi:DNA-binding response OmpR family regulator
MCPIIALVDDDPAVLGLLEDLLSGEGYRTLTLSEGREAFARIAHERPDLVILDLWMEEQDTGWAIYDALHAHDATARIPIIICSADITALRERITEIETHGDAAVEKPFEITNLLDHVDQLLARSSARQRGPITGRQSPAASARPHRVGASTDPRSDRE